jgi:cytochrome P450
MVLFSHPTAIREILTGDADHLLAGAANAPVAPVLGQRSLLVLDGRRHRHARRLVLPPFQGERLQAYAGLIRATADRAIDRWPVGRPFALHAAMQELTLDVILRVVLDGEEPPVIARLRGLVLDLVAHTALPFARVPGLDSHRRKRRWQAIARIRKQIDVLVHGCIARRRSREAGPDVLGTLLDARDDDGRPLGDGVLCDTLVTLLIAGHETTATALAWTFHHVLEEPAVLAHLQAGAPAAYVEATINETLRLRPVFAVVGRRLTEPTTVAGWSLPAGVTVAPCIYLVHRRAEVWPEPARFDPARFLGAAPGPYEFLPFGGGARRCLGMAFALFEMRLVITRVLARTELQRAAGACDRATRRGITFAPADGVPVRVEGFRA